MKSSTLPNLTLSIMFPRAPPTIIPREILPSLPISAVAGRRLKKTATIIETMVTTSVYVENIPKAIPVFVTLTTQRIPGTRAILI